MSILYKEPLMIPSRLFEQKIDSTVKICFIYIKIINKHYKSMKKVIFFSLFLVLYLSSFSQENSYPQNKPLFQIIYPIAISNISNMEFSEVKRSQYNKMYEVRSTFLILYLNCQRGFNYNITFPSSLVLNRTGGKEKIILNLSNMSSSDLIVGDMGKEDIKVSGSFIMTPTTISGIYQNVFKITVNFE